MIEIDKKDLLYKTLHNLGVDEQEIDNQYMIFASEGIITTKDFNNHLQARLGMDYVGEFDESQLEEVVDYYKDLKINVHTPKSKVLALLKQYKQSGDESLRTDIINSQLKEVLLIACGYKVSHNDISLSDLVQVCNLGLMTAVEKFNADTKLTFETYLNYWILDAINKEFTIGEQNNG